MKQGTTVDDLEDKAGSDVWVYDASKNECDWTLHRYKNYFLIRPAILTCVDYKDKKK